MDGKDENADVSTTNTGSGARLDTWAVRPFWVDPLRSIRSFRRSWRLLEDQQENDSAGHRPRRSEGDVYINPSPRINVFDKIPSAKFLSTPINPKIPFFVHPTKMSKFLNLFTITTIVILMACLVEAQADGDPTDIAWTCEVAFDGRSKCESEEFDHVYISHRHWYPCTLHLNSVPNRDETMEMHLLWVVLRCKRRWYHIITIHCQSRIPNTLSYYRSI